MSDFATWFSRITRNAPYAWQRAIGESEKCPDRLLRVPTGFGKTAGTVLPWLFRRVVEERGVWPTRLVYCLPMRVLVEQTEREILRWLEVAELRVPVHVLMGGVEQTRWVEGPEEPRILVGTQDMLLSRALMRGYASGRGLWPMEYGLVHEDALWVVDEVQLMDVGLATTAQLRAFLRSFPPSPRPRATWWMSATLQDDWLRTVDHAPHVEPASLPKTTIEPALRSGGLWDVRKMLERRPDAGTPEELASLVIERHEPGSLTLVVVNTVKRAIETYKAIEKARRGSQFAEMRLVHSRFRGAERRSWARDFLRKDTAIPSTGRVVVATQVVEAGVDISARLLVTDLAPWPSLVQRFGRCARYAGQTGNVIVAGPIPPDEAKSAPYDSATLASADHALARLGHGIRDVGPKTLEEEEERWATEDRAFLSKLYPYEPLHVLRRSDFLDLFDTSPDLSGADLDISRYIRASGDERDVSVFWRTIEPAQRAAREFEGIAAPIRDELCPVPISEIDPRKRIAFVRDFVDGTWKRTQRLVPGTLVLLDAEEGGYDARTGWDASSKTRVSIVVPTEEDDALARASGALDRDDVSAAPWKTIAMHGRETADEARRVAEKLGLEARMVVVLALAGRWHDAGKAHPVFQAAIGEEARKQGAPLSMRRDLAKAPSSAWKRPAYPDRPGFRHELASVLALYEIVRRAAPDHPALVGGCRDVLDALGMVTESVSEEERLVQHPLARELAALSAEELDLVAWLVATHHGKLRVSWTSTPLDQEAGHGGIAGVCDNDVIPAFELSAPDGERYRVPPLRLSLALAEMGLGGRYGASWSDRASRLVERHGPTKLAWLEAILRAADWRASQLPTEDVG